MSYATSMSFMYFLFVLPAYASLQDKISIFIIGLIQMDVHEFNITGEIYYALL